MKLIYCKNCHDLFSLRFIDRECECGASKGAYKTPEFAWVSGPCVSVAIGNGSLQDAISILQRLQDNRAFYPVMCWVRPNSGPANPRTEEKVL